MDSIFYACTKPRTANYFELRYPSSALPLSFRGLTFGINRRVSYRQMQLVPFNWLRKQRRKKKPNDGHNCNKSVDKRARNWANCVAPVACRPVFDFFVGASCGGGKQIYTNDKTETGHNGSITGDGSCFLFPHPASCQVLSAVQSPKLSLSCVPVSFLISKTPAWHPCMFFSGCVR